MTDKQVALWECPDCCFAFDARHVNSTGEGHSCPNCAEVALTAKAVELERRLAIAREALVLAKNAVGAPIQSYSAQTAQRAIWDALAQLPAAPVADEVEAI